MKLFKGMASLVAFALMVPPSWGQSAAPAVASERERFPASMHIRTFSTALNSPAGTPPHAVHFDSLTDTLALCAGGEPARCAKWRMVADDVLPYKAPDGSKALLVIDTPFNYRSCTVAFAGRLDLDCKRVSLDAVLGKPLPLLGTAAFILNLGTADQYSCGYVFDRGLRCSSAQRLKPRASAVLFGHFTADSKKLQALSIDRRTVCDIGGGCREVQGLDLLAQAETVTASGRFAQGVDRGQIFGVGRASQTACTAIFESSTRVGFSCELQLAAATGPAIEPFTTHGPGRDARESITYAKSVNAQHAKRLRPTDEERAAAGQRVGMVKALHERGFANAGGPMTAKQFKSGLLAADDDTGDPLGDWQMTPTARGPATRYVTDFQLGSSMIRFEMDGDDSTGGGGSDWGGDGWSGSDWGLTSWGDSWGDFTFDWTSPLMEDPNRDKQKCRLECDSDAPANNDQCDHESNVVLGVLGGLALGATAITYWETRAAGEAGAAAASQVFVAAFGSAAAAAGSWAAICKDRFIRKRQECRLKCG